jgi:hypothetical protein
MENVNQPIMEVAQEHIHADECIMVIGQSYTVEKFLKAAGRKRRFQVLQSYRIVLFKTCFLLSAIWDAGDCSWIGA